MSESKVLSSEALVIDDFVLDKNLLYCLKHKEEFCPECGADFADVNLIGRAFRANKGFLPPPNPAVLKQVGELKHQGNELFKQKKYEQAIEAYTQAINASRSRPVWDPPQLVSEEVTVLLSNRAACFLERDFFVNALYDAEIVTRIRPTWPKGHFRKGRALYGLGRYGEAVDSFDRACALDPESKDVRHHLEMALAKA
ncbi:hypothetical protein DSO57_1022698 [Entomophthora muscae]|uniref:Uncharacterized protein n=2 Tax=Entomophthora muscae TaxID=34485 RepID=A0ACC2UD92_9FUNG|nr:hypothetical protein DSO57_1019445 [Entomophthora muscae]KAJ9084616.1 hypothetical protein DSO57_1022698 [Entomophthora muscae]